LLNAERFCTAHQAESAVNIWLHQYNHIKPHHRLNIRPRVPETLIEKTKISGPEN
jgi:putative transposase